MILYVLLCGYTPFMSDDQDQMFEKIKQGQWEFDPEDWKHVSQEAQDLITQLLEPNADLRMTAARALRSKWINKDAKELSTRDLSMGVLNMKERRPRLLDLAKAFMAIGGATTKRLGNLNPIKSENNSSGSDSDSHQLL